MVYLSIQSPVFLNTRGSLQSVKSQLSGHLSSDSSTAAEFLLTSFPLGVTARIDGAALCLSEVENPKCWMVLQKGSVSRSSENGSQILAGEGSHGKAVSAGTCLAADDDSSYSLNSKLFFHPRSQIQNVFLIGAPAVLVSVHASPLWCSCSGGIVCTWCFPWVASKILYPHHLQIPSLPRCSPGFRVWGLLIAMGFLLSLRELLLFLSSAHRGWKMTIKCISCSVGESFLFR